MNNKNNYVNAVDCLNYNYDKIFSQDVSVNSISVLHREDIDKFDSCSSLKLLFDREPLEFILINKDNSICFYSKPSGGELRSKQFVLLYLKKGIIQDLHLSTNLKLISNIDTSWYQLERITSLAD